MAGGLLASLEAKGDLGSLLGGFGGAAQDLFGAAGDAAEGKAYSKAAQLSLQNAQIAKESTDIQEAQARREVFRTIGSQSAGVAGAGFANSGSALDLLRSSAQQGSLTKQLIQAQGQINVNGYEQEASSYKAMAKTAKGASFGGIIGGLVKGATAAASAGFL